MLKVMLHGVMALAQLQMIGLDARIVGRCFMTHVMQEVRLDDHNGFKIH